MGMTGRLKDLRLERPTTAHVGRGFHLAERERKFRPLRSLTGALSSPSTRQEYK
jgi:hypothetical protein